MMVGETLTASLLSSSASDVVLYLLSDCSILSSCLDGSDAAGAGGNPEEVSYSATMAKTVYVIVDAYNQTTGGYVLSVSLTSGCTSDSACSGSTPYCNTGTGQCEPCPSPAAEDLVLNEILIVPDTVAGSGQTGGDANCDGVRNSNSDQFVEIVNIAPHKVKLDGVQVKVKGIVKYTFPSGTCLDSRQASLVFGGGIPACPEFSDAIVKTAPLSMRDDVDTTVEISSSTQSFEQGKLFWMEWALPYMDGESLQRYPELNCIPEEGPPGLNCLIGDDCPQDPCGRPFTEILGSGARKQSPGRKINGVAF